MDSLAGLEPQLAIPVILVVVGAILVYMFGFKQTEEPSYEHLAVLQSSSSTFHKTRSGGSNNPKQQNKSTSSSANSKPKANGHLPSGGGGAMSNGSVKKVATAINKENKPPAVTGGQGQPGKKSSAKDPANKPEDFESGEWIPAVSRKEKGKKKEAPSSPGKKGGGQVKGGSVPVGMTTTTETTPIKAPKIEDLLAEMNILKEIEKQNHSTQTTPDKKVTEVNVKAAASPAKGKGEKVAKVKAVTPPAAAVAPAAPAQVEKVEEKVAAKAPAPAPKKSNIAFDEMGGGDSWEEAKSRGAKKRARKD